MGKAGHQDRRPITRREFLRLSGAITAGAALAACGGEPAGPITIATSPAVGAAGATAAPGAAAPTAAGAAATAAPAAGATAAAAVPTKFNEAPMLAELVKAGKLPPVDQRLPKNPVVLDGVDGVGQYGGTIRRGYKGVSDYFGPNKVQQVSLIWYNQDLTIRPDL